MGMSRTPAQGGPYMVVQARLHSRLGYICNLACKKKLVGFKVSMQRNIMTTMLCFNNP